MLEFFCWMFTGRRLKNAWNKQKFPNIVSDIDIYVSIFNIDFWSNHIDTSTLDINLSPNFNFWIEFLEQEAVI